MIVKENDKQLVSGLCTSFQNEDEVLEFIRYDETNLKEIQEFCIEDEKLFFYTNQNGKNNICFVNPSSNIRNYELTTDWYFIKSAINTEITVLTNNFVNQYKIISLVPKDNSIDFCKILADYLVKEQIGYFQFLNDTKKLKMFDFTVEEVRSIYEKIYIIKINKFMDVTIFSHIAYSLRKIPSITYIQYYKSLIISSIF